ncbi:Tripeptidyl aminopeptidase [Streptomyces sp. enrichment culture]|nr:alpha/beta fold hydrolase [Streptomyces sp. KD18]GGS80956.1 alpha/beta hydrolase [Streptomyces toxytricini]
MIRPDPSVQQGGGATDFTERKRHFVNIKRLAPVFAAAGLLATTVPLLSAPQASAAGTAEFVPQKPAWQRCSPEQPASYECATVKVPLDYRRPQGRTIDIAISRLKSADPAKRHGVLLMNPGGPGGPGLDMPLMAAELMPKDVRDRYDVIGFDPRGVGASSPVTCGLTDEEQDFNRPYKEETFAADVAWAQTVAEKCREKSGQVLPFITSRNTARDMDAIRAALGEKKISYVGYSYGTYLGTVYSQMFPSRTDRFVLDSGVDPKRAWRGMIQVWATEAEPAFARWTRWAAERDGEYRLGATPDAVSKTFWDLVARADREPIEFEGQKLTGDDIRTARALFFYPAQASPVVRALVDAAEGRPAALTPEQRGLLRPASEPASDNGTAAFWAVVCGDVEWPRYPEQYAREAARDKAKYPLYGDFASNIKPCAYWQRPIEPPTKTNVRANVLTVQNEWDSQTPLDSGRALHRALSGSRMVLAEGGEGHGVYLFEPESCVNATVNAYLAGGGLPAADVTCRTAPAGGERRTEPVPSSPQRFPGGSPLRF